MYSLTELEKKVSELYIKYNSLTNSLTNDRNNLEEVNDLIESHQSNLNLLEKSKPYIDELIQKFSENTLSKLEDLLTFSIKKIFFDHDYSIKIIVSEKRSQKCAELFLIEDNQQFSLSNSCVSGGVLTVIGTIIQFFYIANLPVNKVVFLDESFSCISSQYIENFMLLIHELAENVGLKVVLITHDMRFTQLCDRQYNVKNGVFTLEK